VDIAERASEESEILDEGDPILAATVDGTTHHIAGSFRDMVCDLFNYTTEEFEANLRMETDHYGDVYPVVVLGPGEYNALVSPIVPTDD